MQVRVTHRDRRIAVDDHGGAVARAGRPSGWRDTADRIADELVVNITRPGVVALPVVRTGPGEEAIIRRIAEASLTLYQELLELG